MGGRPLGPEPVTKTALGRRLTACGAAFPATCPTTRTFTRRCSVLPATGPVSAAGLLHLDGDTQGMVSLDHAVWFHRPARVDAWLSYDVHSLVNSGGRGLLRGVMRNLDDHIVVSVAQEMLSSG